MLDVDAIRRDFPILEREFDGKPLVYLDSAATSQKPNAVIDAEAEFYRRHNANAHRGIYTLGEEATEAYEGAREKIARFFGTGDPSRLVFTRGTTESVNLVAHGWARPTLHEGDEILLTEMEHHSNIVPWQLVSQATGATLRYIGLTDDGLLDLSNLGELLTERTKIFGVTAMSNALGTIPPLRQLIDAAHAVGATVVVDAAQAAPHLTQDVDALDADFFAFSGHKMLGPTASGGLIAKREHLDRMQPMFGGGDMIREVFHDSATWNDVPYRFEAGTMQVAQQVGLAAAVDYLEALGMNEVRAHEVEITRYAIDRLLEAGATVFGPKDTDIRGGAVSFWYKDVHPHDLATILNEDGVAIRAGHHCAQLVMRRFGTPATARASFYVYNTTGEVDTLVSSLAKAGDIFAF
ncbi:MAG TPA: cysteine desulfurase [Actinomycetota bacterium]|nr:cysteine desulfurase [Actinomycetota bacterium]